MRKYLQIVIRRYFSDIMQIKKRVINYFWYIDDTDDIIRKYDSQFDSTYC